ncbi:MAG: urease accessory protein UreE [Chromatiaceae bacterium]|nr:MAG: urease accessory protein UreE [Chromatiaceae bacterium]
MHLSNPSPPTLPLLARRAAAIGPATARLALTWEQRQRSRLRAPLTDGRLVGILLPRGQCLRDGDLLASEDGALLVQIQAASECLSTARTEDPLQLARACWHLGNRHVAVQISPGRLSWLHDHVLDAMVRGLGLMVTVVMAPFEPESGAYAGGHVHGDGRSDGQGHGPGADHGHGHPAAAS